MQEYKVNLKETILQIRIIRLRNVYSQRYIENMIYGLSLFCIEKTKRKVFRLDKDGFWFNLVTLYQRFIKAIYSNTHRHIF